MKEIIEEVFDKYFPELVMYDKTYAGEYGYEGIDIIKGRILDTGDDKIDVSEATDQEIIGFLIKNHFTYGPAQAKKRVEGVNKLIDPYLDFKELEEVTDKIEMVGKDIKIDHGMYIGVEFEPLRTYTLYKQSGGAETILYIK